MAGLNISPLSMKRFISSAVDVIIQISRLSDVSRKMISFQELSGMEGEIITMQEIFAFEQKGVNPDGKVRGAFLARGVRPKFSSRLEAKGISLPASMFEPKPMVEV